MLSHANTNRRQRKKKRNMVGEEKPHHGQLKLFSTAPLNDLSLVEKNYNEIFFFFYRRKDLF